MQAAAVGKSICEADFLNDFKAKSIKINIPFVGEMMTMVVYEKDDKTVTLVGMMHVGEPRFYDELYKSFPEKALVIVEGVSDREGLLAAR